MDDLDREIEVARRLALQGIRRRRLATIASVATFFVVGIASSIVVFTLFPEPDATEYNQRRRAQELSGEEASLAMLAGDYSAQRRDQGRTRWKVLPIAALTFASAYFVFWRLRPSDQP